MRLGFVGGGLGRLRDLGRRAGRRQRDDRAGLDNLGREFGASRAHPAGIHQEDRHLGARSRTGYGPGAGDGGAGRRRSGVGARSRGRAAIHRRRPGRRAPADRLERFHRGRPAPGPGAHRRWRGRGRSVHRDRRGRRAFCLARRQKRDGRPRTPPVAGGRDRPSPDGRGLMVPRHRRRDGGGSQHGCSDERLHPLRSRHLAQFRQQA